MGARRSVVCDENQVRAAAGLTMAAGAVAFAYAYFDKLYVPLQVVAACFFVEFALRLTVGIRFSPTGVVAGVLTRAYPPEWVSAKPKRFAWTLGLVLSGAMTVDHQQRHPRRPSAHDLPALPDADVARVGTRALCRLRDPRRAGAQRVGRQGRGLRDLCARRVRRARAEGARMTAVDLEPVGTNLIDELRATEYRRLDAYGHLYFDYTGAGLHAESQIREHLRLLNDDVLGNPHSASPSSAAATALVERGRAAVLRYFNADDDYACIFTPNATGALRLVGESYPFAPGRPVPRDLRQPQLGQRHPPVRPSQGGTGDLRPARRRRPAGHRRVPGAPPADRRPDGAQPVRLPRAVQLLGRQAPPGVDRPRARPWLGRAARLRRVRADQPARPVVGQAGLRRDLVLQDVRLPDRASAR